MSRRALAVSLACLAVVLFMGTAPFGSARIDAELAALVKFFAPASRAVDSTVALLRKISHVVEYAGLALIWYTAFATDPTRTPRRAVWLALAVCLGCAFVDETHQAMTVTRTASGLDFFLDGLGAVLALTLVRFWSRGTPKRSALSPASGHGGVATPDPVTPPRA